MGVKRKIACNLSIVKFWGFLLTLTDVELLAVDGREAVILSFAFVAHCVVVCLSSALLHVLAGCLRFGHKITAVYDRPEHEVRAALVDGMEAHDGV